jgi:succinate--hydroxymethylglutarate CoA-transferase
MQLSDMGAEVIKIESLSGDETRKWKPPFNKDVPFIYYFKEIILIHFKYFISKAHIF